VKRSIAYRIETGFVEDDGQNTVVYTVFDNFHPVGLASFETKGRAEAYIEGRRDAERGDGTLLVIDLKSMLEVYARGKENEATRGQALSCIRDANEWIRKGG
jgi:hypothetical protein